MKKNEIEIKIAPNGQITTIHDDQMTAIFRSLGARIKIHRASHVEPDPEIGGNWRVADSAGNDRGHTFPSRADALAWERTNFWDLIP